jgi:hypothetical protein
MTLPQRMVPADPPPDIVPPLGDDLPNGRDRGPANAVIAKLAHAIAEQNVANATDPVLSEGHQGRAPSLGWFVALGAGSATFWLAAILIGRALL